MITLKKNSVLLFQGDSITNGARGASMDGNHILGHGYQYIISAKLAIDNYENTPKFINKGVSGESIAQIYSRLNYDVLKNKPDLISFLVGINDIGKGLGQPLGRTSERYIDIYNMMLDDIAESLPETRIVICEPFYLELDNFDEPYKHTPYAMCESYFQPAHIPKNDSVMKNKRAEITIMQHMLKDMAEKHNCIYVSLQDEFFKYSKKIPPEYLIWDTVHPTVAGHEIIARKWLNTVESALK